MTILQSVPGTVGGGGWTFNATGTLLVKAADESRSNTTTMASDTDLRAIVTSGRKYRFWYMLAMNASSSIRINWKFWCGASSVVGGSISLGTETGVSTSSVNTAGLDVYHESTTNLTNTGAAGQFAYFGDASPSGHYGIAMGRGFVSVVTSSSNRIGILWAPNSSSATAVTMLAGSMFYYEAI